MCIRQTGGSWRDGRGVRAAEMGKLACVNMNEIMMMIPDIVLDCNGSDIKDNVAAHSTGNDRRWRRYRAYNTEAGESETRLDARASA